MKEYLENRITKLNKLIRESYDDSFNQDLPADVRVIAGQTYGELIHIKQELELALKHYNSLSK